LLADKGYDSQDFVDSLEANGIEAVIPPRKNRKQQRIYDKYLYTIRHMVENAIQQLKEWRGVATRYAKRASSFLTIVQIRCAFQWLRIL
jgi:transposase